jgi:hypothetical protein
LLTKGIGSITTEELKSEDLNMGNWSSVIFELNN